MIFPSDVEKLCADIFKDLEVSLNQISKTTIRIELNEDSFIDIFQSLNDSSKYASHAKLKGNRIYRLDCFPEKRYSKLSSFPWHFHSKFEDNIEVSPFSTGKKQAIIQFLNYIKRLI